ncbi:MAG: SPOR domain-containing protein [Bacteroidales bacterium]
MKRSRIVFTLILVLIFSGFDTVIAQLPSTPDIRTGLEQQYEEYITGALRLQVKADSLTRTASQKRRELAFSGDADGRSDLEEHILDLERESHKLQKQADSLYAQARATELRMMAGRQGNGENIATPGEPSFLVFGDKDISSMLSRQELSLAAELEPEYERANYLMWKVSDMTDEMESLGYLLDSDPRRKERRRINRQIDELSEETFRMKMEAMQIYEKVNKLRYTASIRFLEERREELKDSALIKAGLEHEQVATENFNQAQGLRATSADMLSDKYLEGYILRAYTEELKAFEAMEKALDIYNSAPDYTQEVREKLSSGVYRPGDPAAALSGAGEPAKEPVPQKVQSSDEIVPGHEREKINFGFAVLPEPAYSNENPVPFNVLLPMGLVYSIQLGVFNVMMTPDSFGGLIPVMAGAEPEGESVSYFTGVFRTLPEAEKALIEVGRQGFSDAFVVAYNDRRKVSVNRAGQIERSQQPAGVAAHQATDAPSAAPPADPSTVNMVDTTSSPPELEKAVIVTFRIQLGAFSRPLQSDVHRKWLDISGGKKIDYTVNNRGLYVYYTGNFYTFDEAVRVRDLFRQREVPDAFIIPYKDDLRISMEEANQLMNKQ